MIRVCPKRDTICPHGMECPYTIDRYSCKPEPEAMTTDRLELAKALEWKFFPAIGGDTPDEWFAASPEGGSLTVTYDADCECPWVARPFPQKASNYATADEAKAALEAERESRIRSAISPALLTALGEARRALEPFAHIAAVMGRKPPQGSGDTLHEWQLMSGTAALRHSDCLAAKAALAAINAIGREG